MSVWWALPAVALASLVFTGALRRYALAGSLMDVPNARSSHSAPTPRGGGLAIVLSFLIALLVLAAFDTLSWSKSGALLGSGALVALVGLLDDHGHIAARWRLLAHLAGAIWALVLLGGAPPVALFGWVVDLGWLGFGLAAVCLVWLLNLYNFMDGIDGIASVETICACVGGAALYLLIGQPALAIVPLLLAAAVAGFLCWNFPPAKIFLGDAGSGFLGIVLGVLSLQAAWVSPALLWSWVILLGVFVTDATFTLICRLFRGEKLYEAHRSHAYQHASRRFGHLSVTLAVSAINLVWLLPIALWVGSGQLAGVAGAAIAYIPLIGLAMWYRAGRSD